MFASATATSEFAHTRATIRAILGFRPGLPLVVFGFLLCLLALFYATWFSPGNKDTNLSQTHDLFSGVGLNSLANEPVEILVNNKLIAKGEVVVEGGKYGIRVIEVLSREDRIKSLR